MQAGLFSAIATAFIAIVQPKLESDPTEMAAIYMQILIHTTNNSLFPDVDPSSAAWTSPPPEIVTVQSLLCASLATALFAAFLAMLGKQWVNRYIQNRGGSAADKSRDRQQKLDGLEKWHFHLTIESLPVMLQFALLLLGCALSRYLWTISRIVAGVSIAFTLLGVTSYIFFTLAATIYYDCPYHTPPSILTRTLTRYLAHDGSTFARSVRSLIASLTGVYSCSIKTLSQVLISLRSGVCTALQNLGCGSGAPREIEHVPLAVVEPSNRLFGAISIDREVYNVDARCVYWVLSSTTDSDVIFSTVRFAADMIWYPEIAGALPPRILADLFLDCLMDGRVIPGKLEHASVIGMALASVLSIQLSLEPKRDDLRSLCRTVHYHTDWVSSSEPTFLLGVSMVRIVSQTPDRAWNGNFRKWDVFSNVSDHLPTARKLCLSRVILQTIWRWRRENPAPMVFNMKGIELFCRGLMANGDHILSTLKIHCFLIMTISLGLQADNIHDLYIPNKESVIPLSFRYAH